MLLINNRDNNCKVIKWRPIFMDCILNTYRSEGHLEYTICTIATVPDISIDPFKVNTYYGASEICRDKL